MLGPAIHLRKFQNVRYYIVIYAIYWPFSGGVIPDDKNNLLWANKNSRYFLTHWSRQMLVLSRTADASAVVMLTGANTQISYCAVFWPQLPISVA